MSFSCVCSGDNGKLLNWVVGSCMIVVTCSLYEARLCTCLGW